MNDEREGDGVKPRPPDCPQCHQRAPLPGNRCGTCGLVFQREASPRGPIAPPAPQQVLQEPASRRFRRG